MKLGSHPGVHACPIRTLRQLKAISAPFAQSETQPTTAFLVGSRLRYWLYPFLKRPCLERASKPLLRLLCSQHSKHQVLGASPIWAIFVCLVAISGSQLRRIPKRRSSQNSYSTNSGE